ncbi:kelch repeat-containing protein [Periophthalmus magnuspinnatus]|uniref:kelch repeat-containing protein n=1 Tax=Periophthalmus magnuspinnatus TaxID=409849 RepID=UPI00145A92A8|nr:kelch repeat-containing protein [Periophthalmus magnuspinnatus]
MENFGVYAVFGVGGPPQRLICADGSSRVSVSVSPCVQQVVLFSSGPWGERLCVNVELEDAARVPITIGKLTPYNKCLSWEQWEENRWTNSVTLRLSVEGAALGKPHWSEPEQVSTVKKYTPKVSAVPPPRACNLSGKRKREQDQEGSSGAREENICPNKALGTPVRKDRSQPKRGLKLFINAPDRGSEVPKAAVKTPPNLSKTKNRKTRTPTQPASLVSPSSRWGHTLSPLDPHTAILIGGQGNRMHFCEDPMWKLCTEDRSWVHTETLAEGPTPETRMGHTAVYDPDSQQIFMFGGSKNKTWFNDVHILDTCSWRWTMVEALGQVPPLSYHSCTLFRGELWVLGGVFPRPHPQPDECSDALYIFDPQLSIWYQPIVTGDKPAPRSGHSACLMQQRNLYVFGGWDTPLCFNDMHMLDLGLMEFSAVSTYGKAPSPRSWHGSAVLSDSKFLIHGGYNGNQALGDAFIFDTDTNTWTEVALPELHLPRAGHTIITMESIRYPQDEDQDPSWEARALLVFGGGDNEGTFYSDLTTVAMDRLLATL